MNKRNNRGRREMPGSKYTINDRIRVTEVRVVEGLDQGVYSKEDALKQAEDLGLDLVAINLTTSPPICKVVDFKKFLYQEKQKAKDLVKNQVKIIVKEVRFSPNIGEHDYETKKKNVIKFLEGGNKVKCTIFFKGRSIMFKDKGEYILAKLASEVSDHGNPEAMPKLAGKRMSFIIKPIKKK